MTQVIQARTHSLNFKKFLFILLVFTVFPCIPAIILFYVIRSEAILQSLQGRLCLTLISIITTSHALTCPQLTLGQLSILMIPTLRRKCTRGMKTNFGNSRSQAAIGKYILVKRITQNTHGSKLMVTPVKVCTIISQEKLQHWMSKMSVKVSNNL